MNFTREPIIETIITPKEGNKLSVRSTRGDGEEYTVDALEVVSFGPAIFYRSLDRARAFLLPVFDFEVVEVKEARLVLKNAPIEKSVKIGGGKETPKAAKEPASEEKPQVAKDKRERRRTRRRRGSVEALPLDEKKAEKSSPQESEGGGAEDETKVSSSMFASLLRPPSQLISETIHRNKDKELSQGDLFSEEMNDEPFVDNQAKSEPEDPDPSELTPEREKNQPLFPGFSEPEPIRFTPPPLVSLRPRSEEKPNEIENDDDIF